MLPILNIYLSRWLLQTLIITRLYGHRQILRRFYASKFPTSKSRQIGPRLLERVNDQHSRGDQKTIKGTTFAEFEMRTFQSWFWNSSPNFQHLSLQVNKYHVNLSTSPQGQTNRTSYITMVQQWYQIEAFIASARLTENKTWMIQLNYLRSQTEQWTTGQTEDQP